MVYFVCSWGVVGMDGVKQGGCGMIKQKKLLTTDSMFTARLIEKATRVERESMHVFHVTTDDSIVTYRRHIHNWKAVVSVSVDGVVWYGKIEITDTVIGFWQDLDMEMSRRQNDVILKARARARKIFE